MIITLAIPTWLRCNRRCAQAGMIRRWMTTTTTMKTSRSYANKARRHRAGQNMPYTDMSGAKIRPALVVQCDVKNARLEDVIVAMITRTTKLASLEPTQLLIDIATPDGKTTRLLHTSAVKCEHLITLHQNLIIKPIGQMPAG